MLRTSGSLRYTGSYAMTRIGEIVAAANEVLRQLDLVAVPDAVALQILLFEMSDAHAQRVAHPLARRESRPGVSALGEGCGRPSM